MLFKLPSKMEDSEGQDPGISKMLDQKINSSLKIESVLEQVQENCCVHWVTAGDWNVHDLLIGLLMYSGPANVYISSYAFSEYPARIISELKDQKMILNLFCLIDSRIDKRSASALTLVRNCATKCKLINTHAKVTIIENKKTQLIIIGSANYTSNKRYETGVIIQDPAVVNFHKKWMLNEINKT
jgi:hypothetical protein